MDNQSDNASELSIDDVLHHTVQPVFIVGRYVHVAWYLVGFVGNIISAVIWNTNHMYDVCSVAHYLVTISGCDLICQFLDVFYYMKVFWRVEGKNETVLCEVWSILYMIPLYISELLVLGISIETLISIRNPFRSGWFTRHQRAPKEIVWIVISVTALSIPQAYVWKVDNRDYCDDDRHSEHLWYPIWNWVMDTGIYVVVPCTVVILNFMIIHEAKSVVIGTVPKKQELLFYTGNAKITHTLRQSTVVLLRLSFFRIITLAPKTIIYFLQHNHYFKPSLLPRVYSFDDVSRSDIWQRYIIFSTIKIIANMIASSRNAVSVVIFTCSSRHFKRELIRRLNNAVTGCVTCVTSAVSRITKHLRRFQEDTDA